MYDFSLRSFCDFVVAFVIVFVFAFVFVILVVFSFVYATQWLVRPQLVQSRQPPLFPYLSIFPTFYPRSLFYLFTGNLFYLNGQVFIPRVQVMRGNMQLSIPRPGGKEATIMRALPEMNICPAGIIAASTGTYHINKVWVARAHAPALCAKERWYRLMSNLYLRLSVWHLSNWYGWNIWHIFELL